VQQELRLEYDLSHVARIHATCQKKFTVRPYEIYGGLLSRQVSIC